MMKRVLAFLLALMLAGAAAAEMVDDDDEDLSVSMEEITSASAERDAVATPIPKSLLYQPISWDAQVAPHPPHDECYLPDGAGYHDDSLDIAVSTYRAYDTTVMAVHVTLTDVSQFRANLSVPYPHKQEVLVSTMAKKARAVLAINGDFFMFHDEGIAMRNGVLYREKPTSARDTLIVDQQGDFHIIAPTTQSDWLKWKDNALHVFCFGPALVQDGVPLTDPEKVHLDLGKNKTTQRIAIGQVGPLEYLILATEGPENSGSRGLTIYEMAQLCLDVGMTNAYNLDGGSSSTIVLNNRKINSVSSNKNRPVGDCIWFPTLVP